MEPPIPHKAEWKEQRLLKLRCLVLIKGHNKKGSLSGSLRSKHSRVKKPKTIPALDEYQRQNVKHWKQQTAWSAGFQLQSLEKGQEMWQFLELGDTAPHVQSLSEIVAST